MDITDLVSFVKLDLVTNNSVIRYQVRFLFEDKTVTWIKCAI